MVRVALAVVLALAAAASVPHQAGSAELPCGVLDPVDRLLECDGRTAEGGDETPTSGAASVEEREPSPRWPGRGVAQVDPNRLLVRFEAGTSRAAAIRVAHDAGGSLERRLPALGLDVVRAEAEHLESVRRELDRSSIVRAVTSEYLAGLTAVQPNDSHWPRQTGLHLAGFAEAWEATRGSADTVVAVLDTGVSSTHLDLAGAVLAGRDVVNGDDDPADDHGHGTAVAGVIAARSNNAAGIAGVCWLCTVLPVKVLSADGFGPTSTIAAGILWATDRGADVINLSLGTPQTTSVLTSAVAYATARGVLVVAAAGNDGVAAPFYPAAEPGALAIAAIDERHRPYSWSNHGTWVQLAAPGCLPTTLSSGDYGVECGTSIAAPVVSGLAALALAAQPTLTVAQLADVLRRGTVPIGSVVRDGRVDAARTLGMLSTARPALASVSLRSTLTEARPSRTFAVRGGGGAWTSVVTFDRRRRLTVSILDANGRVVARARGRSPLRLVRRLPAGLYRIRVSGPNGVFRLAVSRPEADSPTQATAVTATGARNVRLSEIPPIKGRAIRGASLGRPPLTRDHASIFALPRITNPEPIERRIAGAINQLRQSRGLRTLSISPLLARAGDAHARSLAVAGAFTHDWPLNPRSSFLRWMVRYYPTVRGRPWQAGENLLWSEVAVTPDQAVTMWMNSPSHRRIMVAPDWRELGIGVIHADGAGGVFAGRSVFVVAAEFGAR